MPGRRVAACVGIACKHTLFLITPSPAKVRCDQAEHDLDYPGEAGFRADLRGDLATMHGSAQPTLTLTLPLTLALTTNPDPNH